LSCFGQPHVKVWVQGAAFIKNLETLGYNPDIRIEPQNLQGMNPRGMEFWGDEGVPIRVNDVGIVVVLDQTEAGGSYG
jgi:hypothetical protein